MKIAILGFGQEGQSVLKFLKKNIQIYLSALARKNKSNLLFARSLENTIKENIFILDENQKIKIPWGIKSCLGKNYLSGLEKFDIIFRSPGAPYNLPEIQKAIKKGVFFSSATKIFFKKAKGKIIGVTGTKGKGTTAMLIYKILKSAKKNVYLVGNMGSPCLDILPKLKKNSIIVFELSSFQLQDLTISPSIAVILDIFPDHLDKHKNFKEYLEAKMNIAEHQKPKDKIFFFADNCNSRLIAEKSRAEKIAVSIEKNTFLNPADLKIKGPHNFKNALMAAAIVKNLGVNDKIIKRVILNFKGLEHRLEFIGKINGVLIYNDSASTNPESAAAAVRSFAEPQILIAGGKDKNLNFMPLVKAIKNSSVKAVFLFGENKNKIKAKIKNIVPIKICPDLKTALEKALRIAYNGDIIIFSPASASFDMFKDYKDRGTVFKKLVRGLKK